MSVLRELDQLLKRLAELMLEHDERLSSTGIREARAEAVVAVDGVLALRWVLGVRRVVEL